MTSLVIGPLNTAGQAYQWSEAVSRELGITASSFAGTRSRARRLNGPAHHRIPHHRVRPRLLRRIAVERLLRSSTHVLSESLLPLLGDVRRGRLEDEMSLLNRSGITVGTVFHGSDIRDPGRHMEAIPYSFFNQGDESWRLALGKSALRRRRAAEDMGLPAFVSTPDLLLDLPTARWLPLIVDVDLWATTRPAFDRPKPVVLHMPSQRTPAIKGTGFIAPILTELARQGRIEYRSPGSVRHERVPQLVQDADVVVEQILAGSYGVAAVEAMAAGRLVIGNVGPETRAIMDENPPILDASPDTLLEVMSRVLESPAEFADRAATGPAYVHKVHAGRRSADALTAFLQSGRCVG